MLADTQGEFTKVRFYFSLGKPLKKVPLDSVFEGSFFFLFYSLLRCKVSRTGSGSKVIWKDSEKLIDHQQQI